MSLRSCLPFLCLGVTCLLANIAAITFPDESEECANRVAVCSGHRRDTERDKRYMVTCPSPTSLILVTNVTSYPGLQEDGEVLTRVRRSCMGHRSCNVSALCSRDHHNGHTIHFLCVHAPRPETRECPSRSTVRVEATQGFLVNPEYPAADRLACQWHLEPPPRGQALRLTLHDLDTPRPGPGHCSEGGLQVRGSRCHRRHKRQTFTQLLHCNPSSRPGAADDRGGGSGGGGGPGSGHLTPGSGWATVVSCGRVEVRVLHNQRTPPLRFWLSYSVQDLHRAEPLSRGLRGAGLVSSCPPRDHMAESSSLGLSHVTFTTEHYNQSLSRASGVPADAESHGSTMTVLIALVCVIGLIALVLSVILTVVCLKRRRPKVELIEHVYALPTNCTPLDVHAALPDDGVKPGPPDPVPRPQIRVQQAYSDVADARLPGQPLRLSIPTSPSYAEVEECPLPRPFDGRTWPRFHFRSPRTSARPSVSSSDASSTHYEDISPVPPGAAASSSSPAGCSGAYLNCGVSKSGSKSSHPSTLDKDLRLKPAARPTWSKTRLTAKRKSDGCNIVSNLGLDSKRGQGGGQLGRRVDPVQTCSGSKARSPQEMPEYVHVLDSVADADPKTSRSNNTSGTPKAHGDKSTVAPLAAKFDGKADSVSAIKAGKTELPQPSRLYPLQEGKVASLVSTLNKKKEAKNGDVLSKELGGARIT